jgi:hypothetical protein
MASAGIGFGLAFLDGCVSFPDPIEDPIGKVGKLDES